MLWACLHLPQLALDAALRRQPAATAAEPDDADRAQQFLAAWAYRYSDQVSTAYPQTLLLEVGASFGLFGPWPDFARRLRSELAELGFQHRLALAPCPLAARVLAGAQDGLAVASAASLEPLLARLPVSQALFAAPVQAALEGMGLRRLDQVFAAPRAGLARRFGTDLLQHLDRLRGRIPEPLPLYRPPDVFEAQVELAFETENSQVLLFPLRRLVSDLAAYLAGRDGGVQDFQLVLEHEGRTASTVRVGLLAPERDPVLLFELARTRLEQATVPAPVRGLRLRADALPPFVPAARGLFDRRPAQAMDWSPLRERLRARLGEGAVQALGLVADHRPERMQHALALPIAAPRVERGPRPTWLLARPLPWRGPEPELLAGPERIEAGWWDGEDCRRDYYVARSRQGQCAWIFCAPGESGPWMLHGWFA